MAKKAKYTPAPADLTALVARDPGDVARAIEVPLSELANPIWMHRAGGRAELIEGPAIGGYMERSLIPPGAPFGHDGLHGPGRLKVAALPQSSLGAWVWLWFAAQRGKYRGRVKGRRVSLEEWLRLWLDARSG